jgi:hypothetical protein
MAKNVVKAKVEVPGEKLERFQHLDKNLRELQAEYRKVKDRLSALAGRFGARPAGWLGPRKSEGPRRLLSRPCRMPSRRS